MLVSMARLGVTAAAVLVCVLTACTIPPTGDPVPQPSPESDAIRMAAVGDSITDADSEDFAGGILGPQSWVSYAISEEIEFVGGWAEWSASTARMAEEVQQPFDADVLVIVAGTNDAGWTPHDEIGENLSRIADAAAVDAVMLSSVPPNDFNRDATVELNAYLERFASDAGWTWVDAAADVRDGDRFAEGTSYDGVHPTEQGARAIGEAIGAAILDGADQ